MGYDLQSLLQLPLFLGMGRSELADIEQDVQIQVWFSPSLKDKIAQ